MKTQLTIKRLKALLIKDKDLQCCRHTRSIARDFVERNSNLRKMDGPHRSPREDIRHVRREKFHAENLYAFLLVKSVQFL